MTTLIFFFAGLALILVHEMDAIRCREWAIFPLLSRLDDKTGYLTFTAFHVPLYFLLLFGLLAAEKPKPGLVIGLDVFFIVHVALHIVFLRHPQNQFKSLFSWAIIAGAGLSGLIDLFIRF